LRFFFIFMMTTLGTVVAAPFITKGLAALALVSRGIFLAAR
jgi:MFS transporter, DHA1 family, multidrug resistance protein